MRLSYKFRLYPNKEQSEKLDRTLDLLRDFYNAALQERRDAWRMNRVRVTCFDQIRQVPDIRVLNTDYREVAGRTLEQTLRQLDKAFAAFFRRVKAGEKPGYPRFKGRTFFNSIVYNRSGFNFRDGKLILSLIGNLKIKLSRPVIGNIKEVIAKRQGRKWFAIVSCDNVPSKPLESTGQSVGVDMGIENFATLSDGTQIENDRYYQSAQAELRTAQRRVARRRRGSKRRGKAVAQLRQIHQRILNKRSDFQHKISTWIVQSHDLIAVEDLNTQGLCKSILSKQVHDVGWSEFFHKLSYKAESAGRQLVKVNPAGTSQTCICGERCPKELKDRLHECLKCGRSVHRDINSAQVILKLGLGYSLQDLTYRVTESVS